MFLKKAGPAKAAQPFMLRIITALALRLFAVYLLAFGLINLPVLALSINQALTFAPTTERAHAFAGLELESSMLLVALLLFVLLWRLGNGALRNAGAIDAAYAAAAPDAAGITFRQWQGLLLALLGIYFFARGLNDAMTSALAWMMQPPVAEAMRQVLPGAHSYGRLLTYEHTLGEGHALIALVIGLVLIVHGCRTGRSTQPPAV